MCAHEKWNCRPFIVLRAAQCFRMSPFSDCGLCLFPNSSSQFLVQLTTEFPDNKHRRLLSLLLPHSNVLCFTFIFVIQLGFS